MLSSRGGSGWVSMESRRRKGVEKEIRGVEVTELIPINNTLSGVRRQGTFNPETQQPQSESPPGSHEHHCKVQGVCGRLCVCVCVVLGVSVCVWWGY
jgi:hypothetical protein